MRKLSKYIDPRTYKQSPMTHSATYKQDITATLASLEKHAKENANTLEQSEIAAAFAGIQMTAEQMNAVLQYFQGKQIEIIENEEDEEEPEEVPSDLGNIQEDDLTLTEEYADEEVPEDELELIEEDEEDLYDISINANIEDSVKMYLKEIGQIPLLTADEEVRIATRIENGIAAAEVLQNIHNVGTLAMDDLADYNYYPETKEALTGKTKQELATIARDGEDAKNKLTEEKYDELAADSGYSRNHLMSLAMQFAVDNMRIEEKNA